MIRLKKEKLLILLLVIVTVITGCNAKNTQKQVNLKEENIERHLSFLTQEELEGRFIGTEGNQKTINYIEDYFKEIGLLGYKDNKYKMNFSTIQPQMSQPSFQVISDKGELIKTYAYMENYHIPFDGLSVGGTFTGDMVQISHYTEILKTDDRFENLAILIDYSNDSIKKLNHNPLAIDERLHSEKASVVIYPEGGEIGRPNFKLGTKINFIPERGILKLGVEKEVYEELVSYQHKGYKIQIDIPLLFNPVVSSNVIGMIPGKSKQYENYIIIATSMDGLGKDVGGRVYPSASDNAASLSLLLELAREMKEQDIAFDATVYFMVFNGKHTGNVGVENYFSNYLTPSERTKVIFLDELGGEEEKPLTVATFQNPNATRKRSLSLVNRLAKLGNELEIDLLTNSSYGKSEYISFRKRGIIASVLTKEGIQWKGTPLDTMDSISIKELSEVGNLVLNYTTAYGNVDLLQEIMVMTRSGWWMLLLLIFITLFKIYYYKKDRNILNPYLNKILSYPIISLFILLTILYMVLTLQVWYIEMDIQGVVESQVNLSANIMIHNLLLNFFAMVVMGFWFCFNLGYVVMAALPIMYYKEKMNNKLYLLLLTITGAIAYYFPFKNMYSAKLNVLIPEILSPQNITVLVPIVVGLLSFIIVLVYMKEKELTSNKPVKKGRILLIYLIVLFIITVFVYAPYLSSKEVSELRSLKKSVSF